MTLSRHALKNSKNLQRRKYYFRPDDTNSKKFRVIRTQRVGNELYMLAKFNEPDDDYVVFTFWLEADLEKHHPSDKWTSTLKKATRMFEEMVSTARTELLQK